MIDNTIIQSNCCWYNLCGVKFQLEITPIMLKKFILIFSIITLYQPIFAQGKLDRAQKSIEKNEKNSSSSRSRYASRDSNGSDSRGSLAAEIFGPIFIDAFFFITYGALIETPMERDHLASNSVLTKYPYNESNKGNYSYEWGADTKSVNLDISNRFIAENSKLYGNHLNTEFHFVPRISLEADYLQLWEESVNFQKNTLATYTFLAKYHRVRTEKFNAWWAIGATHIDGLANETGFTYGLGAEVFMARPLSLELIFNHTFVNNETLLKFTPNLNYHFKRLKLQGGYEYLKIGSESFSFISTGLGIIF